MRKEMEEKNNKRIRRKKKIDKNVLEDIENIWKFIQSDEYERGDINFRLVFINRLEELTGLEFKGTQDMKEKMEVYLESQREK